MTKVCNLPLIVLQLPSGEFINLAGFKSVMPRLITDRGHEIIGLRITWHDNYAAAYYCEDAQAILDWLAAHKVS